MTALAGIWDFRGGRDVRDDCARMLAAQSIYGRHGERRWVDGPVALGRRLWRLVPEDVYDTQPLQGRNSGFVLIADLRLDNREELAAELGVPAAQAATMCDAALLLAAFERWDEHCCNRLVGAYAFALWDPHARRLVVARDFLGARPLHYHRGERFFAFASMPKGLHALPEVPCAPDEEHAAEFIALLPEYGARTFFKDIERVEPGRVVTVTDAAIHARRHWNWQRRTLSLDGRAEYVEGLRHHLDQAVQSQLRGADGRVAASMSGGLDSTAVAATAARLLGPSGGKVVAFTAVPRSGYDLPVPSDRIVDEGPLAATTAAMYPNMVHVLVSSSDGTPLDTLGREFFLCDRPLLNLCTWVWGRAIYEEIRARKLTVLLSGGGGNMTLSYDGAQLLAELARSGHWMSWARTVATRLRRREGRLRGMFGQTFGPWLPPPMWQLLCRAFRGYSSDIRNYSAIRPDRLAELDLPARARAHGLDFTYRPWKDGVAMRLWALRRVDQGNNNKGTLGGWGIDYRDPTVDRRLVEFCLSVPTEQFFHNGVPRALARAALADRLPPEVLSERRRGVQAVDWHERATAARQQIADELSRLEQNAPAARALDLARLRRLTENWPIQGWHQRDVVAQYRYALLRGISVGHFLRRASGGNA